MSVMAMSLVWAADVPRPWKLILLAYADHASDDGSNIFPAQGRVAWKTGYSRRQVNTITGELVDAGILTKVALQNSGVIVYKMNYDALPQRPDYSESKACEEISQGGVGRNFTGGGKKFHRGCEEISHEPSVKHAVNHHSVREQARTGDSAETDYDSSKVADELFGPIPDPPARVKIPDGVDPTEWVRERVGKVHDRMAERAGGKPWLTWGGDGIRRRGEVSAESIRWTGWVIEQETGLTPTDGELSGWVNALAQIYQAGEGNEVAIRDGIREVWGRPVKYRPGHARGFVDEVRKASVVVENDPWEKIEFV